MTDLTNPSNGKPGKVTANDGHTYHKSASANATVAPTSGVTASAAQKAEKQSQGLTEQEIDFITILDMHWGTTGTLLKPEEAVEHYSLPVGLYQQCMKNDVVKKALIERGLDLRVPDITKPEDQWRHATLTPQQLIVANVMLDLIDTRNDRKKLQDLGVSTTQWNAWLRKPEFQQYLQGRAESLLGASQHEAMLALVDKVRSGDIKAIEYYHEFTGKFTRRVNGDGTSGAITAESVKNLVQSIIEIIVEEVEDPVTGARISERLGNLIDARNAANAIVEGTLVTPITVPEILPAREITPEIEALMESGVGSDN